MRVDCQVMMSKCEGRLSGYDDVQVVRVGCQIMMSFFSTNNYCLLWFKAVSITWAQGSIHNLGSGQYP